MLLCALRANSHDVHGLPRFRTNDVLLGTSGVGVCVSVVSSSSGMLYESPPAGADFQSQRLLLEAFPRAGGPQFESWSTHIFHFCSHLSGLNFAPDASYESNSSTQASA